MWISDHNDISHGALIYHRIMHPCFRFKTEAEVFKWSFVFEMFVADDIRKEISNSVQGKILNKYCALVSKIPNNTKLYRVAQCSICAR